MGKFFAGLALGILGALLWIIASVLAAVGALAEGEDDLFADPVAGSPVVVGFVVVIGGPVLYWFILPIVGWLRCRGRTQA